MQQIGRNIELIRYRQFGGDLLLLESVNAGSDAGSKPTAAKPPKATPGKPDVAATAAATALPALADPIGTKGTGPDKSFADLLVNLPEPIQLLLASLEGYTLSLGDDVQRKELRLYLAFKRLKNFATVVLHRGDGAAVLARMQELLGKRREKQPLEWPSAGSTFKRPQGAFAGKLIEDCGLRGFTVGGAQISEKHCGFVINRGGATCADVVALTEQVRQIVEARTGFVLEREIRVVK